MGKKYYNIMRTPPTFKVHMSFDNYLYPCNYHMYVDKRGTSIDYYRRARLNRQTPKPVLATAEFKFVFQ